ncbi:hypothetical protein L6R29_03085 [Myxococcota bacterium]|nr:hypothetical protein [Myxococcota bacterium]
MKIVFATSLVGNDRLMRAEALLRFCKEQGHEVFLVTRNRFADAWTPSILETFQIAIPRHCPPEEMAAMTLEKNRALLGRMDYFRPLCAIIDGEDFVGKVAQRLNIPTVCIDPKHAFETTRLSITLPPFALEQLRSLREELRQRSFEPRWFLLPVFFDALPIRPEVLLCQPISTFTDTPNTDTSDEGWLLLVGWQGVEEDVRPFLEQQIRVRVHYPVRLERPREIKQEESLDGEGAAMRRRRSAPLSRSPEEEAAAARAMLPNSDAYVSYSVANAEAWQQDLPRAKAVILQGDASQLADAIALQKPTLVIPQKDHFEQWVCGQYIEKMGVGETHTKLNRTALDGFLERLDRYKDKLHQLPPSKSPKITHALQEILTTLQSEATAQPRQSERFPSSQRNRPTTRTNTSPTTHTDGSPPERRTPRQDGDSPKPRTFRQDGDAPRPRTFRQDGDAPRPRTFRQDGDAPRPRSPRPDGDAPRPRTFRQDGDAPRPRTFRQDGDAPRPRTFRQDGDAPRPRTFRQDGDAPRPRTFRQDGDAPRPRFSNRENAPRPRAEEGRRPASSERGERAGSIEVWRPPSKQADETHSTNQPQTAGGERLPRRKNTEGSGEQKPWRKNTEGSSEQKPWRKNTEGSSEQKPWRKNTEGSGEQKPWRKNTEGSGEQKPWRKNTEGSGEQKPWRKNIEGSGERKPWRKNTEGSGERKPWRKNTEPKETSERGAPKPKPPKRTLPRDE